MWVPEGRIVERDSLGSLEPGEILYEYDGEPLTFVAMRPEPMDSCSSTACRSSNGRPATSSPRSTGGSWAISRPVGSTSAAD